MPEGPVAFILLGDKHDGEECYWLLNGREPTALFGPPASDLVTMFSAMFFRYPKAFALAKRPFSGRRSRSSAG